MQPENYSEREAKPLSSDQRVHKTVQSTYHTNKAHGSRDIMPQESPASTTSRNKKAHPWNPSKTHASTQRRNQEFSRSPVTFASDIIQAQLFTSSARGNSATRYFGAAPALGTGTSSRMKSALAPPEPGRASCNAVGLASMLSRTFLKMQ